MKKYLAILSALVFSGILLNACGSSHNEPSTPPPDAVHAAKGKVCYETACADTIDAATIHDPNKDYKYADHRNAPKSPSQEQYRAPYAYLDLQAQNPRLRVATNFLLGEFVQVEKGRYGVLLPVAVRMAQAIRDALGGPVRITSGYRSPGYNARVDGSATWSRHTYGDALDMQNASLKKLEQECIRHNAYFVLAYTSHVHCDWRSTPLDPAFYAPSQVEPAAQKSDETPFEIFARQLSAQLKITAQTDSATDSLILTVELPEEIEAEGVPLYRWRIRNAQGEIKEFTTPSAELPRAQRQAYDVEVTVGETLHTATTLEW